MMSANTLTEATYYLLHALKAADCRLDHPPAVYLDRDDYERLRHSAMRDDLRSYEVATQKPRQFVLHGIVFRYRQRRST